MEKSSFFNSVNGDRKYQASDFASYFNSLLTNGVFPNPSTNLQIIANNNMTVTVKAGKAWINGYVYINDSDLIIPIAVADGVLNRVDRIVVQFNTINRNITTKVKKGVFASTPIATVLQRDADVFELGIGDIYVGKGVTSISQSNITDLRMNTSYCGWVNSLIQADTTAIFNQYLDWFTTKTGQYQADMVAKETDFTNQFNNWFTTIQGQLSGDIAGNLLNQINSNSNKITVLNGSGEVKEKANLEYVNTQLADYTKQVPYAVVTGTANTYVIATPAITALTAGMAISVKINIASTGASTLNWDGKGAKIIKKANGTNATNLVAGGIYTLRYDGTNFILQGEGGSGDATASDLLLGKKASVDAGDIVGIMIDRGGGNIPPATIYPDGIGNLYLGIQKGAYLGDSGSGNGLPNIIVTDANFIASNLLAGKTYFGLAGTAIAGKRSAKGTTTSSLRVDVYIEGIMRNVVKHTITGLTFKPSFVFVYNDNIRYHAIFDFDSNKSEMYDGGSMYSGSIYSPVISQVGNLVVCAPTDGTYNYRAYE